MTKDEKIATTKAIARFVVGKCASAVVVTVVHNNCPVTTKSQKVQLVIGAAVVGAMVSKQARAYTDEMIDEIVELWDGFKNKDNTPK